MLKEEIIKGDFSAECSKENVYYTIFYEGKNMGTVDIDYYYFESNPFEVLSIPIVDLQQLLDLINECQKQLWDFC